MPGMPDKPDHKWSPARKGNRRGQKYALQETGGKGTIEKIDGVCYK